MANLFAAQKGKLPGVGGLPNLKLAAAESLTPPPPDPWVWVSRLSPGGVQAA